MSKLYVGFSVPRKWKLGAKLICWWTGAPYSHVYVRFSYSDSKDAVFHAANGMVHFRSIDNFSKDNLTLKEYEIGVDPKKHEEIFDFCMDLAGEGYGTLELAKIVLSDVVFFATKKVVRFSNSKGYICSELIGALATQHLGVTFDKPLFLLKPTDIDLAMSASSA